MKPWPTRAITGCLRVRLASVERGEQRLVGRVLAPHDLQEAHDVGG